MPKKTCSICTTREPVEDYRPFCSKRCADIDLSRWLGGKYAIPSAEPPDEFELDDAMERLERESGAANED